MVCAGVEVGAGAAGDGRVRVSESAADENESKPLAIRTSERTRLEAVSRSAAGPRTERSSPTSPRSPVSRTSTRFRSSLRLLNGMHIACAIYSVVPIPSYRYHRA